MADLTVPNFTQAAEQQATGNLQGAQTATTANRVNQFSPFGSSMWSQDPTSGMWSQTTAFSPEQQQQWQQYMNSGQQLGGVTNTALGNYANPSFGGVDPAQIGQSAAGQYFGTDRYGGVTPNAAGLQDVADQLYGASTARLDPQFAQREQSLYTQLYNQGLRPGTEAWTNAAQDFNNARNDAYQQARGQAMAAAQQAQQSLFGMGQSAQNQAYNQAMGAYSGGMQGQNAALNQALSARGVTAPTNPTFANYYQQQATTGPDYLNALGQQYQGQIDMYNADISRQNAMLSGLYGLGSGILGLNTGGGTTLGGQLLGPAASQLGNWFSGLFSGTPNVTMPSDLGYGSIEPQFGQVSDLYGNLVDAL